MPFFAVTGFSFWVPLYPFSTLSWGFPSPSLPSLLPASFAKYFFNAFTPLLPPTLEPQTLWVLIGNAGEPQGSFSIKPFFSLVFLSPDNTIG